MRGSSYYFRVIGEPGGYEVRLFMHGIQNTKGTLIFCAEQKEHAVGAMNFMRDLPDRIIGDILLAADGDR